MRIHYHLLAGLFIADSAAAAAAETDNDAEFQFSAIQS
jgi:hypothetical protein